MLDVGTPAPRRGGTPGTCGAIGAGGSIAAPEAFPEEAFPEAFPEALDPLWGALWDCALWDCALWDPLCGALWDSLWDSLWGSLWDPLWEDVALLALPAPLAPVAAARRADRRRGSGVSRSISADVSRSSSCPGVRTCAIFRFFESVVDE